MNTYQINSAEIYALLNLWVPRLLELPISTTREPRNNQNRSIREIVGHMIDSASNNIHRIVHLQYQPSPLHFPDYANLGNNDRWIAIQHYQEEDWGNLVQLWKFLNLHVAHIINYVREEKLNHFWISALNEHISLDAMIKDYNRHLNLHLQEIEALIKQS